MGEVITTQRQSIHIRPLRMEIKPGTHDSSNLFKKQDIASFKGKNATSYRSSTILVRLLHVNNLKYLVAMGLSPTPLQGFLKLQNPFKKP